LVRGVLSHYVYFDKSLVSFEPIGVSLISFTDAAAMLEISNFHLTGVIVSTVGVKCVEIMSVIDAYETS